MIDLTKLIEQYGLAAGGFVASLFGGVYLIKLLLNFVLKEQRGEIRDLKDITVKLIDANKKTQMMLSQIAGKVGVPLE